MSEVNPRCKICTHAKRDEISKKLAERHPVRAIADAYDLSPAGVHRHKKHIRQLIARADRVYEERTLTASVLLRPEVSLPPLEKIRTQQNRCIELIEREATGAGKLSALRELRGWFSEEAKISGLYQEARENDDQIQRLRSLIRERAKTKGVALSDEVENYLALFPNVDASVKDALQAFTGEEAEPSEEKEKLLLPADEEE